MNRKIISILPLVFLLFSVFLAGQVSAAATAEGLLPPDLSISDTFKPGYGKPIGKVQDARGLVVILHKGAEQGYKAFRNTPLYENDTIVTSPDGRTILQFNDQSILSLTSDTKLAINRSIYDPEKKERSSFMGLLAGKTRFLVAKLKGFRRTEYRVKTRTLVAGVRGSDFVIIATEKTTEVAALDDTEIEVFSLASPEKVLVLRAFEKVTVEEGKEPSDITRVTPEEGDQLRWLLPLPDESSALYSMQDAATEQGNGDGSASPDGEKVLPDAPILVAGDDLVDPEEPLVPAGGPGAQPFDPIDREYPLTHGGGPDVQREALESRTEDLLDQQALPDMPSTP